MTNDDGIIPLFPAKDKDDEKEGELLEVNFPFSEDELTGIKESIGLEDNSKTLYLIMLVGADVVRNMLEGAQVFIRKLNTETGKMETLEVQIEGVSRKIEGEPQEQS